MSSKSRFLAGLCFFLFAPFAAGGDFLLEQEMAIGVPGGDINAAMPFVVGSEGEHRLAVVSNGYLLGLQWSSAGSTYDQRFIVQGDFAGTSLMADVDGDGVDEVIVIDHSNKTGSAWDALSGDRVTWSLPGTISAAAAQDLDGAPGDELILATNVGVSAYKAGAILWQNAIPSARMITAGGADSATRDILVHTGDDIVILDARGVERRRHRLRCGRAAVGHADADASIEIACYTYDSRAVTLIDGATGTPQWVREEPLAFFDMAGLTMVEADGDGRQDVALRTDGSPGLVGVLDGTTGEPLTEMRELHASGMIAAVPIDCGVAMLTVEGGGSTIPDTIHLLDPVTLSTRGSYGFASGSITGLAAADLNADGRTELLVQHSGHLTAYNLQPFVEQHAAFGRETCCTFVGMAAAQLDDDDALEYVIAGVDGSTGTVTALDGVTHDEMWTATTDEGEVTRGIAVGDLNGDGQADVITRTAGVHSGAKGEFVYAFDGASGRLLWRSVTIRGLSRVALVRGERGGVREVLALSESVGIVRLDAAKGIPIGFDEFTGGSVLAAFDPAGPEAGAVVATGTHVLIRNEGIRTREVAVDPGWSVVDLEIVDADGDGTVEILLVQRASSGDGVRLDVRAPDLSLLWTSGRISGFIPYGDENLIALGDIDDDGSREIALRSAGQIRIFRVGARPVDTTAPRFHAGAVLTATAHVGGPCCATVHLHWDAAASDASPPVRYEIYRSAPSGDDHGQRIGTTMSLDFVDRSAAGAAGYRYSVRAIDDAGNIAAAGLESVVVLRPASSCSRRRAVRP